MTNQVRAGWINESDMVIGLVRGRRVMIRVALIARNAEQFCGTQYSVKTGERVMRNFGPVNRWINLADITIVKPGDATLEQAYAEHVARTQCGCLRNPLGHTREEHHRMSAEHERREALASAKVAQAMRDSNPNATAIDAALPLGGPIDKTAIQSKRIDSLMDSGVTHAESRQWIPSVGDQVTLKGVPSYGVGTVSRVDDHEWLAGRMAYVMFPGRPGGWQYVKNLEPVTSRSAVA